MASVVLRFCVFTYPHAYAYAYPSFSHRIEQSSSVVLFLKYPPRARALVQRPSGFERYILIVSGETGYVHALGWVGYIQIFLFWGGRDFRIDRFPFYYYYYHYLLTTMI